MKLFIPKTNVHEIDYIVIYLFVTNTCRPGALPHENKTKTATDMILPEEKKGRKKVR